MFTGLVETVGRWKASQPNGSGMDLVIECPRIAASSQIGDSIALAGCCLTVVKRDDVSLTFQAGEETLSRTNLGGYEVGQAVNLERSLQVGSRLGGHFVTGHVDCLGTLVDRQDDQAWSSFRFRLPRAWLPHLAAKGSVAVDGVSLTVVDVVNDTFSVALIPHTLTQTTLGTMHVGQSANIETDLLAKYVECQLRARADATNPT